ncbi:MAG: extracellular solute-binding protein [Spirochaetaceae bacterium]|nr:extracellular solute-binding protein [Spirochaetaceae bacterium]
MKKFVLVALLPALFGALFPGCKEKDGGNEAITLRVLNYFDGNAANASEERARVWEVFAEANPDIRIIREDLFNEAFHDRVAAYVEAGDLPEVIYAWPSGRSAVLHDRRLLKDLGPFIAREGLADLNAPAALDPDAQGAGYLAILPQAVTSSHAFYINNAVLRDAGLTPAKTYGELKAQVPRLRAKGYETLLMANKDSWVMQSCLFSLVAGRFGGDGWERRILSGEDRFTGEDFVRALGFIKTLYDDGVLSKKTLATDYDAVVDQFATNQGAYYIDGDWRIGAFITNKSTREALIPPSRQGTDIQIAVFPDIEGARLNRSSSVILGTGWGISAAVPPGSPTEEAAWRLVKWLSGKEVQGWLLAAGGLTSPTRLDIETAASRLEPLQRAGIKLASQYTTGTVVIDGVFSQEVSASINEGLRAIGLGTKTPEQVAAEAQAALSR